MLLLLTVLVEDGERCSSRSMHKITIGPQGWQWSLQTSACLTQESSRTAFDQLYQAMQSKLRSNASPHLDRIRHHFQFLNFGLMLLAHFPNTLFESLFNRRNQHLPAILRTPDHMLVAGRAYIPIALRGCLIHRFSIEHRAIYVKSMCSSLFALPIPPTKERAFHPRQ